MSLVPASFLPFWMHPGEAEPPSHPWGALAAFVGICGAGAVYAAIYTPSIEGDWGWYPRLLKPEWTPSPMLAANASLLFFALLAVAGWRVWRTGAFRTVPFTGLGFATLLVLQSIWSTLFYGFQSPLLGLVDASLIAVLSVLLWLTYRGIDSMAGWLSLPLVIWSGFSLVINAAIWRLNP